MIEIDLERKERFRSAVHTLNVDRQRLADSIGYKKRYLDQILSADKNVSEILVIRFTKRYKQFNPDYILHGKGGLIIDVDAPDMVEEKPPRYGDPLDGLRELLDKHEQRIRELEEEVRLLKVRL